MSDDAPFFTTDEERNYVLGRVNYYNKIKEPAEISNDMIAIADFKRTKKRKGKSAKSAYFFDLLQYLRYFPKTYRFCYLFGDITYVPKTPTIVKSRPIEGVNNNSILLNLNKIRHFLFVDDKKDFRDKKNMLIGRLGVFQPHRVRFWEMYFDHPLCDLGQTNSHDTQHPEWIVKRMSIEKQLEYKFILCLEGNDVATNLKWVMSSNSLAVMPKPHYETWFMEGLLIPNYHYVEIKSDYSDLEERLQYYIKHPDEALKIIENAQRHVAQFLNKERENFIAVMTLKKYFEKTGQH